MKKKPSGIILIVGIVAIVAACLYRFVLPHSPRVNTITSSTLTKAVDIADLSAAEFKYRGIAEIYSDEARKNVRCRICYSAVVKAGIDMSAIDFSNIDHEKKKVTAKLPEIDIKVNIVDETSIAVLPSDADVDPGTMLKFSKEDAAKEARESEELFAAARENVEAIISGLLQPILKPQGYTLVFQ